MPDVTTINANDPSTFHRHNYQFVGNTSDTMMATGTCPGPGTTAMRFYGIDGLLVENNLAPVGPIRCMTLADVAKVRNSCIIGNSTQNAIRASSRYYQSADYCESSNMVGLPLTVDKSTLAPHC